MMTFDELESMLDAEHFEDSCLGEWRQAVLSREVERESIVGKLTAGDALRILGVRAKTTEAAGVATCGFDSTLIQLGALSASDLVLVFHYTSDERVFSVFVSAAANSVIGCIRVPQRRPGTHVE